MFDDKGGAGSERLRKGLDGLFVIVRVDEIRCYLGGGFRLVRRTGIITPLLVEKLHATVGVGYPDDLRNGICHDSEACFAFAEFVLRRTTRDRGVRSLGELLHKGL